MLQLLKTEILFCEKIDEKIDDFANAKSISVSRKNLGSLLT